MTRIALIPVLVALLAAAVRAEEADPRRTPVVVAVEKVAPAVVNISTTKRVTRPFSSLHYDREMDRYFRRFFRRPGETRSSLGSGAIIDPDGYVVTNHHVVAAGDRIQVTVLGRDGEERTYDGRLINSDPDNDLALVKIDGGPFPYVEIAEADDLMVGETVIAVGNPIGLGHTVTTGVLSARGRSLALSESVRFTDLLQTDASINPGNSGGPLLDINGRLIGVNTAIVRHIRGMPIEGIGFSIPAARVRTVLDQLLDYEKLRKISLGFDPRRLPRGERGVLVSDLAAEGPARKAGLRDGDRIVALGGRPVAGLFEFKKRILACQEGDRLDLGVRRGERVLALPMTVAEVPTPAVIQLAWDRLGAAVALPEQSGLERGIGILGVRRDGPAHEIGAQRGDILVELAGRAIEGPADLVEMLEKVEPGRPLRIRVWRHGRIFTGSIELE